MENILFATVLYIAVVSGLCWLTTPITGAKGTGGLGDWDTQETYRTQKCTSSHNSSSSPRHPVTYGLSAHAETQSPHRPVASGLFLEDLKNAFAIEPDTDAEVAQEEVASPTNTNIYIEDIDIKDIETLKLRPARKIASQLGIQQKVGGKDQPLSWLRAQIKKRLEEDRAEVAPIIRACG